jgi:hypothetical protein
MREGVGIHVSRCQGFSRLLPCLIQELAQAHRQSNVYAQRCQLYQTSGNRLENPLGNHQDRSDRTRVT